MTKQKIVIIKYNAGNIRSVLFALERLGVTASISDDPELIFKADKVIFPGVGEASSAMEYLRARQLDEVIKDLKQPVLGICLGMQLMCSFSEENNTDCLGIFNERVSRFRTTGDAHGKIPQVGWNTITDLKSALFAGLPEESYCYFVHGYAAEKGPHTIASTYYIGAYSSALNKDNFFGVQFHPEKSAGAGEKILSNFLSL